MASGLSVQWTGQERELSSHAFLLTLTFPTTDGAMAQGDSSWVGKSSSQVLGAQPEQNSSLFLKDL